MKVLISYLFCTKGGVETALYNRLRKIDRTKLEVDLHFFRDDGGRSLFNDFAGLVMIQADEKKVQESIREKLYDVVISIDSVEIFKILHRMNFSGKIGLEIHTTYEKGLQYLSDRMMNLVDFVIVPSKYQRRLVEGIVIDKKIYILGNAVNDCIEYRYVQKKRSEKKIILWVGRIDKHKNWRLFLRIAGALYQRNKDFLFWIVGGLKSEQSEINELENMIYEYKLECVVRWIPQIQYECISEIYSKAADSGGCYISTSMNESFGMTIIEAMACKCPVIVNNVGALPELVDCGRGLCVENMDSLDQIEKIYDFIENKPKRGMIENAYKYVKEKFSSETIGNNFGEIIRENGGGYLEKAFYNICIFGSCCSRDIFEYDFLNRFTICTYIARQSIISSVSSAVPIAAGDITLDSSFQKRQIYCDFNKTVFEQMKAGGGEW